MVAIKTIGQVLKEKRTALGLGLSEAEQLTQVQKLYIVALETDDYKALPGEFYIKAYLKQYSEKLGLNADRIIQAYDEGKGITVEEKEDILETYRFVKPSERIDPEEEDGPKTWRHYVPIISLSAVALLILAGVIAAVLLNKPATPNLLINDYSYSETTKKTADTHPSEAPKKTPASSVAPAPKIVTTGAGTAITAKLSAIKTPIKVDFSVTAGSNIWVGMTNSNLAAGGETLADTNPTISSVLNSGVTDAVISVGTAKGLTISINGQKLDLSALTTTGPVTITLQIAVEANAQTPANSTTTVQ